MNNDQQPNISPDFGYIINQQVPDNNKKGADKRIVFIVVAVILLFIMFIASIFLKANSTVKQGSVTGPAAEQVISFNEALKAKDYQKAAGILGWSLGDTDKTKLAEELQKASTIVDQSSCIINSATTKGQMQIVKQTCTTVDKRSQLVFDYTVTNSNNTYYIMSTQYAVEKL